MNMAKKDAIGNSVPIFTSKNRRRSKPVRLRGSKKLGPKSADRGARGRF